MGGGLSWAGRAAVFLRAADLLSGPWRDTLNAATMLGQSKTAYQAEIDSACELADFWRFNVAYVERLMNEQPISSPGVWNQVEYRPLEGFVFAVAPFNFTAIAGNLPTAPAMMGNTVLLKPASTAVLAAALPDQAARGGGPAARRDQPGARLGPRRSAIRCSPIPTSPASTSPGRPRCSTACGGRSATTSTATAATRGSSVETGGKDFIFAHPSADPDAVATAIIRGGFEYQGQKCSACSRVYAPSNLWPQIRARLEREVAEIAVGDVRDFRNFMGAVIDSSSFETQKAAIAAAEASPDADVLVGGDTDDSRGYFVRPTVITTTDPTYDTMRRELFGPVVTVYEYGENRVEETLELCDATSPYALTGAIFATDRTAIEQAATALQNAAGNFYINDKPTGAVVGQQPFGGARASGTNDKAGSLWNLIRWTSPRTIKETFVPAADYRYPFMEAE